ncbi:hypothetical protein ABZT17_30090 [Streptomyces sp. NPDC005648]|uniref:hypothetical protein n=1 Tax=Streptomyces sp. NPDC005648 TaxID=3157044 RepID=UPI0033B24029
MLVVQLVGSAAALLMGQLLQKRYGIPAVLGLLLLGIGIEARSTKCAGVGAALLMLAVAAPQT